jgi:rare lipoprotein A
MRQVLAHGLLAFLLAAVLGSSFAPAAPVGSAAPAAGAEGVDVGIASWYGPDFNGRKTSSGEIYDKERLTAAHRTLPFGTFLLVRDLDNGSSVVVRINDRGPFAKNRIIDLSEAAARIIGMVPTGTARVSLTIIPREEALAWRGGGIDGAPALDPAAVQGGGSASTGASGDARVRIQVASYASEANARGTVERLTLSGLHATIESARGHYRVVILDLSVAESRAAAQKLDGLGYRGYSITTSMPETTR